MTDAAPHPQGGPGSIFLFDAYNFLFRAYHALPMLNAADGTPVNAVHGFVRMVQAVRREFAPELLLVVFDAGGDGGRKSVFEGYKAQRPPPPEDLRPQFGLVRAATDALSLPRVEHPDFEADDLIASYACRAHVAGKRVVIVSSDKDLMQLCTLGDETHPSILLWDTMKTKAIGPAEVEAKFGVAPALLGDLLALTGDSSDNIPGVPGIGPKTAAALLLEHGDLEGVLAAAPAIKQAKRRENLIASRENARLSRRLVTLHTEVPLPRPLDELTDPGVDPERAVAFFEPLGFKQVMREVGATLPRSSAPRIADSDPGAVELVVMPFERRAGPPRTWLDADRDALPAFVVRLAASQRLGLFGVVRGQEPLGSALLGFGVCSDTVEPTYFPIGHRQHDLMAGKALTEEETIDALRRVLEDASIRKTVHDAKGLAHVLANVGVRLEGVVCDPMLISYTIDPARSSHELEALAEDVLGHALPSVETLLGKGRSAKAFEDLDAGMAGPWVSERAEVTFALGEALAVQLSTTAPATQKLLETVEMPLSRVLLALERRGIALDQAVLARQGDELAAQISTIAAKVHEDVGYPVNLDSPLQLQKLLFEERGLPPTRKTKTGFSTDAKALEELSLLDPIVRHILEYRSLTKLKNTYLDALPRLVSPETGRLHTSFNQAVASTGRLSSSDPNLQNIPIRTAEGRRIREAFVATEGRVLVALDYSQIELRVLAHLSGDPNLMSAFLEDVDVHRRTAAEVFGVEEARVTDEQRRIAKAVNFGVVYGQTAFGLAQQLGIPRGKAGSYIRAYFEKIPGVDQYMRALVDVARQRGYAETILGRRRRIPELSRKGAARSHGERIARNTPIQGSAADILKIAMIAVESALSTIDWAQMLLTVHDELIFECEEGRVEELVDLCRPLMEGAVALSIPLKVEGGSGRTWAACKG